MVGSGARVRVAVDVEQPCRVDVGVDLGRRQAGVAQQFLERTQVGAAREKVRREAVTQGVRGDTVGQAQRRAYQAIDKIQWPEGFCRRDIGWQAIKREQG